MSDKLPHIEPSWITAAGAVVAATIGGFALWLANRLLGKAAFQTAINSGFRGLLDEINADRASLRAALESERLQSTLEREQLRGEVRNLTQAIDSLHQLLRAHGIPIPEKRYIEEVVIELPASRDRN